MDHRETPGGQIQELKPSLRLRPAQSGEAATLSALAVRSKGYWGYDDDFMATCARELTWSEADITSAIIWIAENETGNLLGFCELRSANDILELDALYVDPSAMGQGAGKALWQKAESVAFDCAARMIGLDADPHAVGFYEHMGATVVGEAPSGSIAGRMLPRMELVVGADDG